MNIEYRKAIAIDAWDVYVDDIFIERHPRKKDAVAVCDRLTSKYIN
jgi:hypothetical protein